MRHAAFRIRVRRPRLQRGVSLTEIMIGLTLGLLVTAAIVQVYLSSARNRNVQESLTSRQESARFAADVIQADAQVAGFRGCLRDIGNVVNTLNNATEFRYNFGVPIQGFNATGGGWSPALPAEISAAGPVAGTDVLTLRSVTDPGLFVLNDMASSFGEIQLDPAITNRELAVQDILVISNCEGASIFQVSGIDPDTGVIQHAQNAAGHTPGNATDSLSRAYTDQSQLFQVRTTSYFIAESANLSGPALWRRVGDDPAQELAEGVESLQVLYGLDNNGNQTPDIYVAADAVPANNWINVVSIQVALLVAGVQDNAAEEDGRTFTLLDAPAVGPFDDGRLRRVVTFTVALRNRV